MKYFKSVSIVVVAVSLLLIVVKLVGSSSSVRIKGEESDFDFIERLESNGFPDLVISEFELARKVQLHSLVAPITIVNFWASWCSPCVEEVPSLIKLLEEFDSRIKLIAISEDSNARDVETFAKAFPKLRSSKNILLVLDEGQELMKQMRVTRLPESFILDQNKKLLKKVVGTLDWFSEDSQAYFREKISRSSSTK